MDDVRLELIDWEQDDEEGVVHLQQHQQNPAMRSLLTNCSDK